MTKRKWFFLLNGLAVGLLAAAGWQVYRRRSRERIPSIESLDDPEVAQAFGRIAKMPQMRLLRRFVAQRAIELLSQQSGAIVDLGCGPGWLVIELAQRAPDLHIVGVDLSGEMLAQGEDNARRAGVSERVSFRQGDAQQVPFPDGSVDMVVSTLSLHHWSEPVAVLNEVARVVRPGGAFLIFDLRRDMPAPAYLLLWFAQNIVLPSVFRRAHEPLGSRNAAYTLNEAAQLAEQSRLSGWRVTGGPFWTAIEGKNVTTQPVILSEAKNPVLCSSEILRLPAAGSDIGLSSYEKIMKTITLRPAEPERDFGQLAAWFSSLEEEPTLEPGLKEYYKEQGERIIQRVAEDERGGLLGFYWAIRDRLEPDQTYFYLFVRPEQRGQGVARQLYEDLAQAVQAAQAKRLRVSVWDTCPEGLVFAERRGFTERLHRIAMVLSLGAFDDRPYDEIIARLKGEGFQFTSMADLGNTEKAQRKLYSLNDMTSLDIPGMEDEYSWASFEDFQQRVCRSDWYKPGGQMVVIDTATSDWVAMSAITRREGNDYAYNLHTGVDKRYRGRKLGQAVKVLALRYARDVLKANTVRTHHTAKNLPMIAIDHKLGYVQMRGTWLMEKMLA